MREKKKLKRKEMTALKRKKRKQIEMKYSNINSQTLDIDV